MPGDGDSKGNQPHATCHCPKRALTSIALVKGKQKVRGPRVTKNRVVSNKCKDDRLFRETVVAVLPRRAYVLGQRTVSREGCYIP